MPITISRSRGFVELCLDMAKQSEWETAQRELDEALEAKESALTAQTKTAMLNDPDRDKVTVLADEQIRAKVDVVTRLQDEMRESTLLFELQAVKRGRWNEVEAQHPPRDGNMQDARYMINISTFVDEVLPESVVTVTRKTDGEVVEFDAGTEWLPLSDELTDGQYSTFARKVLELNRTTTSVPFSQAASELTAAYEQSSSKPSDLGSASSD